MQKLKSFLYVILCVLKIPLKRKFSFRVPIQPELFGSAFMKQIALFDMSSVSFGKKKIPYKLSLGVLPPLFYLHSKSALRSFL